MDKMQKLCGLIEDELKKVAEKGLNSGNLEVAYKLVDMYKDLKNTEYWDIKSEYYMGVLDEMQGGYSQDDGYSERRGQKRDSRGRYSRDGGYSQNYDNESSFARRGQHYVRGHYSRNDGYSRNNGRSMEGGYSGANFDRYMDSKQSYRSEKSPDCKQRLMESLEDYMEDMSAQMEEMLRDSDCAEERATIKKYLDKIKSIA